MEMTMSLQNQFANFKKMTTTAKRYGAVLGYASLRANLTIAEEYILYIQRYGPPMHCGFNQVYLELLRDELRGKNACDDETKSDHGSV